MNISPYLCPTSLRHLARQLRRSSSPAFTLIEVVVAMGIAVLAFSCIIAGLTQGSQRVEWATYNFAAQNLAQAGVEQARAAQWDTQAIVPVDNCTAALFPPTTTNILDVPVAGANFIYATNTWTITNVYTNNYPLKLIRVDCTWPWTTTAGTTIFTNTVVTYRAPAQ